MTLTRMDWIKKKIKTAEALSHGECGGTYLDALLIMCTSISSMASAVWPNKHEKERIDQKRFVEIIREYSDPQLCALKISIPLLVHAVERKKLSTEANALRKLFLNFQDTLVLNGDDVDKTESEIQSACPNLPHKTIREHTYAGVLYREVRSILTHEYGLGDKVEAYPLARDEGRISYVNLYGDSVRHLHFPLRWVSDVALSIATAIEANGTSFPFPRPSVWWMDRP